MSLFGRKNKKNKQVVNNTVSTEEAASYFTEGEDVYWDPYGEEQEHLFDFPSDKSDSVKVVNYDTNPDSKMLDPWKATVIMGDGSGISVPVDVTFYPTGDNTIVMDFDQEDFDRKINAEADKIADRIIAEKEAAQSAQSAPVFPDPNEPFNGDEYIHPSLINSRKYEKGFDPSVAYLALNERASNIDVVNVLYNDFSAMAHEIADCAAATYRRHIATILEYNTQNQALNNECVLKQMYRIVDESKR